MSENDPVVGHKTHYDEATGQHYHTPLLQSEANAIIERVGEYEMVELFGSRGLWLLSWCEALERAGIPIGNKSSERRT